MAGLSWRRRHGASWYPAAISQISLIICQIISRFLIYHCTQVPSQSDKWDLATDLLNEDWSMYIVGWWHHRLGINTCTFPFWLRLRLMVGSSFRGHWLVELRGDISGAVNLIISRSARVHDELKENLPIELWFSRRKAIIYFRIPGLAMAATASAELCNSMLA